MGPPPDNPEIQTSSQDSGRLLFRLGLVSLVCFLLFRIDYLAIAASLLLGSNLASRILSRAALKGIRIQISTTQIRSRSGVPIQAKLTFTNRNRFLPIFHPTVSIREKDTLTIQAYQHHGTIPPGSSLTVSVDPCLTTRGIRQLEAFSPRSQFPFALHESVASLHSLSSELIVWPTKDPLDLDTLLNDPPRSRFDTLGDRSLQSQDTEAARIRDYHAGDPKQRINWKLSAKLDKLTVIEPRDQRQYRYELHLDSSSKTWPSEFAFERMIRLVRTLVSELSRRKIAKGITIDHTHFPLSEQRDLNRFFDALAILKPSHAPDSAPLPHRRNHLWILPAPNSSILLAPHPQGSPALLER